MLYVQRNDANKIVGLFANPQPNATELITDDHPDVVAFFAPPPKSLNKQLEEAFLQILPSHLGQSYLTDTVIATIMTAKVGVIDANNIDPTGTLAAATIRGITLPPEMEADRQQLLELFP